ncbi:hypothetical protein HispidOSU_002027 [Sigmodon hispidus]
MRGSKYSGHWTTEEKEAQPDIHILVVEPGQHPSCNMGCREGKESKVALNKADQKHEKTVQKFENPNVIVANTDGLDEINHDKATQKAGFRAPSLMGEPILEKDLDSPVIRSSHHIKSLYPVIHRDKGDDWPDPISEANLEGEAAHIEKERYDPPRVQTLPDLKPRLLAAGVLSVLQWPTPPLPDPPSLLGV